MTQGSPFDHVMQAVVGQAIIPLVAVGGRAALGRAAPGRCRGANRICVLFLLASGCLVAGGVSFVAKPLNVVWFLVVSAAYCFLAASAWALGGRGFGRVLGAVLSVPVAFLYAAVTIGLPVTTLMLADMLHAPASQEMDGATQCRTEWWGTAVTASGYTVTLSRLLPVLPFLRRQLASFPVDESAGNEEMSCAEAMRRYRAGSQP